MDFGHYLTRTLYYRTGKSVYLKMVGIIQYMAQIGSFVPADTGTAFGQTLLERVTLMVCCSGDWAGRKNLYQDSEVRAAVCCITIRTEELTFFYYKYGICDSVAEFVYN